MNRLCVCLFLCCFLTVGIKVFSPQENLVHDVDRFVVIREAVFVESLEPIVVQVGLEAF